MRKLVLLAVLVVLASCGNVEQYPQEFEVGSLVTMKIDGRTGMVLHAYCASDGIHQACAYEVRFPSKDLGSNPYSINNIYGYELQRAQ